MRKIFKMFFPNSKNKIRTQIFPKIGKNDFHKLEHIYTGLAKNN